MSARFKRTGKRGPYRRPLAWEEWYDLVRSLGVTARKDYLHRRWMVRATPMMMLEEQWIAKRAAASQSKLLLEGQQ